MNPAMNHTGDTEDWVDELEDEENDTDSSDGNSSTDSNFPVDVDPREEEIEELESVLNALTLKAETIIQHQPRETRLRLFDETRNLFVNYEHYGSMSRLRIGVEKFLQRGNERGKMQFEDPEDEASGKRCHYGEAFNINFTEDDDMHDFGDELIMDPVTGQRSHPLRTVDPDSIPLVTTLPWDPLATKMVWPARLAWPPGLLGRINNIFGLADHESRIRLFHHISRYGPAPIIRLGIAEHVQSHFDKILEPAQHHHLGLTPETRSFLRGVHESHQTVSIAELRLLGRSCRIAPQAVAAFLDELFLARTGYNGMRVFMMKKEHEKIVTERNEREALELLELSEILGIKVEGAFNDGAKGQGR